MSTQLLFHLDSREPFADGIAFGDVGPYERLVGRVAFAIDPQAPAYQGVADVERAPRNADGLVTFTTDAAILKPLTWQRGNRRLLYDVVNRGAKRALQFFNDATHSNEPHSQAHAGNGFLMRQGYTVVWSGWQGDLLPGEGRLTMQVPTAMAAPEVALTGTVRAEFIVATPGLRSLPLSGNTYTRSYPTASLDTATATLTCRAQAHDARQRLPATAWQFARSGLDGMPVPSATDCYLADGFRPGYIYELIYTAQHPLVSGLGFTGVRDLVDWLRYSATDSQGVANPLQQQGLGVEKAYAWGRSQSGRFLREFVYRGFNEASHGRPVFDGIMPHVTGAGRLALNYRFAQPDRYPRQHEDHLYPSDQFPFAYQLTTDPWTSQTDAILKRPRTDPAVIHTQTASEYWQRRGSLVHTDAFGADLAEHPRARVYYFASAQHFAAPGGMPQSGPHQHLSNPLDTAPLLRALLTAMDHWVTHGTLPPASRIPRRSDGTLVPASTVQAQFARLPQVTCPAQANRLYVQHYGDQYPYGPITCEPPSEDQAKEYAVLVPQVDSDGNDVPGIRTPHLVVPMATYTGWNPRPPDQGGPALSSTIGSYLPFAATLAQRQSSGDPRPSVAERYRSAAHYVRLIVLAAQALLEQRLLLEEDAERYVARAIQDSKTLWPA